MNKSREKLTIPELAESKAQGKRLAMVAVGEAMSAAWAERAGVDIIGIGDSLGMTLHGHENTLSISVDQMIDHARAVRRGAPNTFSLASMPYGSYATRELAVKNGFKLMKKGGVDAIKLQGGQEIYKIISRIVNTDLTVLISGESGTGKELVAHNIHERSNRSKGTFIEVNCAAIPSELIESELFGHLKGSFTSAVKDRQGKFEAANNGTLFLDEIGDMSLAAQAKVLRALEESKIQRVGSQKDISVDVRVIAATNKDLKKEIQNGNFREDLYHRLAVIMIEVPELSKRKSDIPILISHFSKLISNEQGIETKRPGTILTTHGSKVHLEGFWNYFCFVLSLPPERTSSLATLGEKGGTGLFCSSFHSHPVHHQHPSSQKIL